MTARHRTAPDLVTIGVYGFDGDTFIRTLRFAGVQLLFDVRQRRGVRGSQYAWANSRRLQHALATSGIAYEHRRELAPTTDLRQLQCDADDRNGVGKRSRSGLAPEYVARYTSEILDRTDLTDLLGPIPTSGPAALLCVERDAAACHRSLIAQRLVSRHNRTIEHLAPP